MTEALVWAFMVIVCVAVALFSAMMGLLVNMDKGGIHPMFAGMSAVFVASLIFLLVRAPVPIF